MSVYNYVATAQPPTAVTHAVVCRFTGTRDLNLVVVKATKMEVYKMTEDEGVYVSVCVYVEMYV
jgi:DNA damage-binding protein 1